jgi:hypothetical protein
MNQFFTRQHGQRRFALEEMARCNGAQGQSTPFETFLVGAIAKLCSLDGGGNKSMRILGQIIQK